MSHQQYPQIVLPYAAPAIAGYSRFEFDALIKSGLIEEEGLIHGASCNAHYYRAELVAFRERARTDPALAAAIDDILGRRPNAWNADVVLPYAACRILGYMHREMAILTEHGVISHLIHRVRSGHFFLRPGLLAFRDEVKNNPALAARIQYVLNKGQEN